MVASIRLEEGEMIRRTSRVRLRTVEFVALIALGTGPVAACGDDQDSPTRERGVLTIYSSLPLQGHAKPQSEDVVRAIGMALQDTGGMTAGYRIKYVSLDDASAQWGAADPEIVEANAHRAAADPSTIAYIGEFNSRATAISLPILNEAGVLQVSPSSTHVGLTRSDGAPEGEPGIFYPTGQRNFGRVVPADHVQAGAVVSYMRDQSCGDVFIVSDGEPFYGQSIADQVERNAKDQDLEVLGSVDIDLAARSFTALASDVREAEAECLFFGGQTANRAVDLTLEVAETNPRVKMFFPDGCAELAFAEHIPPELERRVFITNPTLGPADYPDGGQEFFKRFSAENGTDPEPYAIYGYEAMSVVLDAVERADEHAAPTAAGRQAVIDAFFKTSDRESVLGTYAIDPYGDTTIRSYGGYAVVEGQIAYHEKIDVVVAEPVVGPALQSTS